MKLSGSAFFLYAGMFFLVTGTSVIQSCTRDPRESAGAQIEGVGSALRVNQSGYHFSIDVPGQPTDSLRPVAELNENTGELDIHLGDRFRLRIIQESRTVSSFRDDMNAMNLFRMRIVEETPELLIYQSVLPDGTVHYFHLYATIVIDGVPYTVRSAPEYDFTEADVMRMKEALLTMRPL